MPMIEWMANGKKLECTSDSALPLHGEHMVRTMQALSAMERQVDYVSFEVLRTAERPLTFSYALTHRDGRTWSHEMVFDKPSDPQISFATGRSKWRPSEYRPLPALRLAIMALIARYGLSKFEVTRT